MDLATIIGIAVAGGLIGLSIALGESPIIFFNVQSLLVVVGGTAGATLVRNPLKSVLGAFSVVKKAFTTELPELRLLRTEIREIAKTARKDILLLEKKQIDYPFLAKGVALCVDGMPPVQVRGILETEMRERVSRHKRGQEILEGMGAAAPAFGMLGTLIGLVQMLSVLEDPSAIGPAMALALLTTLYGAFLANVVFLPLADKLKVRSKEERLCMSLCVEAAVAVAEGLNPSSLDQHLEGFLAPTARRTNSEAA